MTISPKRVVRALLIAAVLIPSLGACAAVGGGGDVNTDCANDVGGSAVTPVATSFDYGSAGQSCNNNEFVDDDLDAYAYPAAPDTAYVLLHCSQETGTGATFKLYEVVNGVPVQVLSGDCDQAQPFAGNDPGNKYVLVFEHPASSELIEFNLVAGRR